MNGTDERYQWYKHWCNACDKKKSALESNDYDKYKQWSKVALSITMAFAVKFGMDFGSYLNQVVFA